MDVGSVAAPLLPEMKAPEFLKNVAQEEGVKALG